MQRLLSSLPKIGPTILLVTILGGGFLLGLTGSTSATFHGPPMNRAKPEKRFSPIDEARLGELQCEGRQRALFQGVCHEVTRGSWSLDEVTNVLSISTIDSSGVAELQVVFKQPGRFQAVGGLRHSILDSALARSSGAILDWLTVGEFTETRGGTELGVQSGQGSMQFNMNFEELQIWSEIQPLNSASCDREAQVWDQGTFVGSFAHSCGEPVRTPAGVGLQGLAFSRMRSGAMSTSANLIAYHGFFDASTPFAIPTPDGFETAVGDELRIVFRLPEGKSFWLEGEELSIFSGRPVPPPGTPLLSLNGLDFEVFNVDHRVERGRLFAGSPNGPLAVQMARETAFGRISRVADLQTSFPDASNVDFRMRPLQLVGGQIMRMALRPFGATLAVARTPAGKHLFSADFPGGHEVTLEFLREDDILAVVSVENGANFELGALGVLMNANPRLESELSWIGWAGHCDLTEEAFFELTGQDRQGRAFTLRFTGDVLAPQRIQETQILIGQIPCSGGACGSSGPSGIVFGEITWE